IFSTLTARHTQRFIWAPLVAWPMHQRLRCQARRQGALVEYAERNLARQHGTVHIEVLLHRTIRAGKLQLLGEAAERKRRRQCIDGRRIDGIHAKVGNRRRNAQSAARARLLQKALGVGWNVDVEQRLPVLGNERVKIGERLHARGNAVRDAQRKKVTHAPATRPYPSATNCRPKRRRHDAPPREAGWKEGPEIRLKPSGADMVRRWSAGRRSVRMVRPRKPAIAGRARLGAGLANLLMRRVRLPDRKGSPKGAVAQRPGASRRSIAPPPTLPR